MMIKLTLTIEDIDIDVAEYTLVSLPSDTEKGIVIWSKTDEYPTGPDYELSIKTYIVDDKINSVEVINKGNRIITPKEEIKSLFADAFFESLIVRDIRFAPSQISTNFFELPDDGYIEFKNSLYGNESDYQSAVNLICKLLDSEHRFEFRDNYVAVRDSCSFDYISSVLFLREISQRLFF